MVVKENFCGACLTIPLAFGTLGTAIGAEKKLNLNNGLLF